MITRVRMVQFNEGTVTVGEFRRQSGTLDFALTMGTITLDQYLSGMQPVLSHAGQLSAETMLSMMDNTPDYWNYRAFDRKGSSYIDDLHLELSLHSLQQYQPA